VVKSIELLYKSYCTKIKRFGGDPQTSAKKRELKGKQESCAQIMGDYCKPTDNREHEL
jgi:hypothetical protein